MTKPYSSTDKDVDWSHQLSRTSRGEVALWTLAALLILVAHAGAAWWVVRERPQLPAATDAAAAIIIELASFTEAPDASTSQLADDEADVVPSEPVERVEPVEPVEPPEEVEPVEETEPAVPAEVKEPLEEAEPAEPADLAAADPDRVEPPGERQEMAVPIPQPRPHHEPVHAPMRKLRAEEPKRVEQERPKKQREMAKPASRAQVADARPAARAAAPAPSAGAGKSVSPARWQALVLRHLERRKRYPAEARRARREGIAKVRFTVDAEGNVGSVALAQSSGVPALDAEVVALVRRASPIPAPPPGVGRTVIVPIRFDLR